MTTPETLTALADRVEREEPSRELDCEIAVSVYGGEVLQIPSRFTGDVIFALKLPSAAHIGRFSRNPVEHYTTSLDSAVTLVPEGWHIDVHDWRWSEEPCWAVAVQRVTGTYTSISVKAKTEEAARVSASLRARAADMQARSRSAPIP